MKRLIIVVEGQTEEEFVKEILAPYLLKQQIFSVTPIKIATSKTAKGGFVNFIHLKNDASKYLKENGTIVSMFVDFFRLPNSVPNYNSCINGNILADDKINCLEIAISNEINHPNFVPYIQKHEFESLLFSGNEGFSVLYEEKIYSQTLQIINEHPNPEDINSSPHTAPSKRIIKILPNYEKVVDGNLIALELGIDRILEKCPRFKNWVDTLINKLKA